MEEEKKLIYQIEVTMEEFRRVLNYIEWLRNPEKNKGFKQEPIKEAEEEE